MLAKDPAARPASAAHAWDWLEGVVADELGARWRRAAALPEAGEQSGYVSVVTAAVPVTAPRYSSAVLPVVAPELPAAPAAPAPPPSPEPDEPASPSPNPAAPAGRLSSPAWPRPWSSRPERRGSPSPPGRSRPPRRPRLPKGPSLAERVREVVDPALRANRRVTAELTALTPGPTRTRRRSGPTPPSR